MLAGFVLLLIISWKLALSTTYDLYLECAQLESQIEQSLETKRKLGLLKKELKQLEAVYGNDTNPENSNEENILTLLGKYCQKQGTVLRDFPKTARSEQDDIVITTNVFTLEGDYISLLKLIYQMEEQPLLGKIVSVLFFSKKDLRTNIVSLYATIYIQNIQKKEHENA